MEGFTLTLSPTLMSTETFCVDKSEISKIFQKEISLTSTMQTLALEDYLYKSQSQSPFLKLNQSSFYAQGNLQSKIHPEFLQNYKKMIKIIISS